MPGAVTPSPVASWEPTPDPEGRFSTGIRDLDRLLGGGFPRGSFSLFLVDPSVTTEDLHLLFTPTWLNFLYRSRGLLAVLPARESPREFRQSLLPVVSRRLFDSRVRVVEYVGEGDPAPYVVSLHQVPREAAIRKMVEAEKAVRGAVSKPFIEFTSLEVLETLMGAETASKMYFHGVKRTRQVGNLGLAVGRPGLRCLEACRSLMDLEFSLRRTELGLTITGNRPMLPTHLVVPDLRRGFPHVALVPPPPAG